MIYTARDICHDINELNKSRVYNYVSNRGSVKLEMVNLPEGPIQFKRRQSSETPWRMCKSEQFSTEMLWRMANALNTGYPVQVDRALGASYNSRSALEALLVYTPTIHICYPGRWQCSGSQVEIKKGHKHIIWCPDDPHPRGTTHKKDLGDNYIISEVPSYDIGYDVIPYRTDSELPAEIVRKHSQIQVALAEIANALGMRTWVAVEDHGIQYNGRLITQYPFIVQDLSEVDFISPAAINVGKHIDCIYVNGGLPYALEVEHTTGVRDGLSRMSRFKAATPYLNTRFVIVASDDDRGMVMERASEPQFSALHALYFPYSHVEDLFSFVRRYKTIRGVDLHEFLLSFMEPVTTA